MKKVIITTASFLLFGLFVQAQTPTVKAKDWSKIDLTGRAADHLVFQFGTDMWTGTPDSVNTGNGFSRHFNIYFMYDRPFKSDPHYSAAFGAGIGTSNVFFDDRTLVDVKSNANSLPFRKLDSLSSRFSKSKNYVNGAGNSVYGKSYVEKRVGNRFFGATNIEPTGRVGYGMISFDMGYQVTGVLRDGFGPVMNKVSAGITISGL